jgi:hypothetical protein
LVAARRPTLTSSLSNTRVSCSPSASVQVTWTAFFFTSALLTLQPRRMSSPCFLNSRAAVFATSASAAARNSGSASRPVTSAPSRRHTLPSSSPITPAPITPRRLGTVEVERADVVDDVLAVELRERQLDRIRARCDDDVVPLSSTSLPSCSLTLTTLSLCRVPKP